MKSVLLPMVLALAVAGCVANDLNLTIQKFVEDDPETCMFSPGSVGQTRGLLDVGIVAQSGSAGYVVFPVVLNNLPPGANTATNVERNNITVIGVNVELKPDNALGGAIPTDQRKFFVPAAAGRLAPGSSVAFGVEVIPRAVALALLGAAQAGGGVAFPLLTVGVSPVGDRSGDEIIGAQVDFPVNVCNFCLSGTPIACPSGGFPAEEIQKGSCLPAQDLQVTCCVASSTMQLLCGEAVPVQQTMM